MTRRGRRLTILSVAAVLVALAAGLVLRGLSGSMQYFMAPSEIAAKARPGQTIRLGGLVVEGSVRRGADGVLNFRVTDNVADVPVRFHGVPPDLFKEKQGVVAIGAWSAAGVFEADQLLAKHDENYVPKEVAEALKERGEWRGD